jgi:hypothetical protein
MKIPYRKRKHEKNRRMNALRIVGFVLSVMLLRSLLLWARHYCGQADVQIDDVSGSHPSSVKSSVRPFHDLDKDRFLILLPANAGINNQLQCLNVAANLAIAYNRTLMLQPNAYGGSYHGEDPIPFDELFDAPNVRLPVALCDTPPAEITRLHGYDPERVATDAFVMDPNPTVTHLGFPCSYGDLHHSLPESATHRDDVLLPFHPIYRKLALQVMNAIRRNISQIAADDRSFRLLGIHVRQGDLKGYPAFICPETGYPQLSAFKEGGWWLAACTNEREERLSWDRLFSHLRSCDDPGIPLCSKDYDAIFVATNDVKYVQSWKIPNLFVLDDFAFVRESFCSKKCNHIKDFLVEEMVLVLSHSFQPSAPSSITDIVMHQRLEEHGRNRRDTDLYRAYDNLLLALKKERKGNIINWERLFEHTKAMQQRNQG